MELPVKMNDKENFCWGRKSGKSLSPGKKVGVKYWSGAKNSGKILVGENFSHARKIWSFSPDFFPDKVND